MTTNVVVSPGRCESYLKYQQFIYDLCAMGCNVFVLDHRGQGLSQRLLTDAHKGYVSTFDDYATDLQKFIHHIVSPICSNNSEIKLIAHSMGSAIALRTMQLYPGLINRALLSSPMIAINTGAIPIWFAKFLVTALSCLNKLFSKQPWYFPGQGKYQEKPFEENELMDSERNYQHFVSLYQQNPQLQLGGVTVNWLAQALKANKDIFANLRQLDCPISILQAQQDTIVDNKAQNAFCRQLHALRPDIIASEPKVVPNAKHELFFEIDARREIALNQIKSFIID